MDCHKNLKSQFKSCAKKAYCELVCVVKQSNFLVQFCKQANVL